MILGKFNHFIFFKTKKKKQVQLLFCNYIFLYIYDLAYIIDGLNFGKEKEDNIFVHHKHGPIQFLEHL